MRPIAYKIPLTDGTIGQHAGHPTTVPGLLISQRYRPCQLHESTCWRVVHHRSGRGAPFCFESPEAALELARRMARLGCWRVDEITVIRRVTVMVGIDNEVTG
ncbi:hypothetical protein SAMN04489712_105255 [Thermomonospora echinospora]|uniref:Uncharacterized protein n=1 Tax=Thermomonospora echinospora TaxID=1992 RepID=A0A1H6A8X7_9ACTN|nr:hypothetical protein [Thermomonospora echinospora]SEG44507.1 hypothetical protein SAMN04489712_105255 [Thermomonospora echinospora]